MRNAPPGDLNERDPLIYTASSGRVWYRSHRSGRDPVFFGRTCAHRWDAPNGEYGVMYLGGDEHCAFMESIGRGALKTRFVPASQLRLTELSKIRFVRDLRLIDLVASGGLTRLAAEGTLFSGAGYRDSQRWSRALKCHPARADGIYYRSRYDPARTACALFDECLPFLEPVENCGAWAEQPVLLGAILDHYGFGTDL